MRVYAHDPDAGAFTFALASDMTPFSIGTSTGVITVSDPTMLDREVGKNLNGKVHVTMSLLTTLCYHELL